MVEETIIKRDSILNWIKKEPLSLTEIKRKFSHSYSNITEQAIKSHYIDTLVENRDISFISKTKSVREHKMKALMFKKAFGKIWDKNAKKYYFYTPQSKKVYTMLMDLVKRYNDKDKLNQIVKNILKYFTYLEIVSLLEDKYDIHGDINFVVNTELKIKINHVDGIKKINGKEWLVVGNKLIDKKDPLEFFNKIIGFMTPRMKFVAKTDGYDKLKATEPMINEAGRLYMEMERISQGRNLN